MKKVDPRMHTAEHALNQTMIRMFDCGRCFSAHIEKKKSKCDYHFDRDLTEVEKEELEKKMNEIIASNLEVSEDFVPLEEAKKNLDTSKLPEGVDGDVRVVKIGDYDACPCIGEHVQNTKDLVKFRIVSSSFQDGVLRIRYKLPKE